MNLFTRLWHSSLGKKYLMAVTGCLLFLFVIGHLLGNLQIFLGPKALNDYAEFLHTKPGLIWASRLGLLFIVAVHIISAIRITRDNRLARPREYDGRPKPVVASYASRTMMMSGLIVAAFVIYHLLHFTVQVPAVNLTGGEDFRVMMDGQGRHDVYTMIIVGFSQWPVSLFYLAAMALLCLHLTHGLSAMVQSVGWKAYAPALIDRAAQVVGILIFLGYASIPAAVLLNILTVAKEVS